MEASGPVDAELVHAALRGDVGALGAALERHRAALYGVAILMLRDRARAEDAVQDTFVIAMQRLDSLRDPAALGPWLRTIVGNVCRMELRARREAPVETVEQPGEYDVDREVERLATSDWLWTAMMALPADLRATLMLRHFSRTDSYARIATVLGVPVGTVRSRLSQGRRSLVESLEATAAVEHVDNARLVRRRWQERADAVSVMNSRGLAAPYFADCAEDVLVRAPAMGYQTRGARQEQRNVEAGLDAGVRMRLVRVLASDDVTIVEADYLNPPDAPEHCPPWHTEIRMLEAGRTTRLVLHFGPRGTSTSASAGQTAS